MKNKFIIPLTEINEILEAGREGLYLHSQPNFSDENFSSWAFIESSITTLEQIFNKCIESYGQGILPHLIAYDPDINIYDKVEIIGKPVITKNFGNSHNYCRKIGVVLDTLSNGNLWIGFSAQLPNAEFTVDSVKK